MDLGLDTRYQDVYHVIMDGLQHRIISGKLIMLGRYHDSVYTLGDTSVTILHGHLTLCVRTQIGHHLAFLANFGQSAHNEMCQIERHWHQALRFVGGITEHHTLIASTLLFLVAIIHTAIDVFALFVDSSQNTTGVTVKLIFGLRITNFLYRVTGNGLEVDIHLAAHLTHDDYLTSGDKRLTCHAGIWVVSQKLV